ncbi:MAG: S1 RNA-binding domain-containing protein, partial [Hyphomicrobiales bacterium]|nr:S1 RNA-binding domain-containing protein [Hyphomicrobiales bacterium]
DLIVHRALVSAFRFGKDGLPRGIEDRLETIAGEISIAERRAMAAERDTVDRLVAHFMADHIGDGFTGRIAGVTRAGLFIRLDDTGADGFVPISTLGDDYFFFEESAQALVGERSGETYRLGDNVDVRLIEAAPVAGALRFEMLSEGRPGTPAGRGRSGRDRRGKPAPKRTPARRGRRR